MLREIKHEYPTILVLGDYGAKSGVPLMVDIPIDLSLRYEKAFHKFIEVQAEIEARIKVHEQREADGVTVG